MVPRSVRAAHSRCGCCSAGVDESIEHALFECKTHDEIRAEFLGRVEKVYPPFGGMSTDARIRLLLADDTPKEIDSIFYRFLIQLFSLRWLLAPQGVGLRAPYHPSLGMFLRNVGYYYYPLRPENPAAFREKIKTIMI